MNEIIPLSLTNAPQGNRVSYMVQFDYIYIPPCWERIFSVLAASSFNQKPSQKATVR